MPTQLELLAEADRRGILPPEKKPLFDEAKRRGLIQTDALAEGISRFAADNPQINVIQSNEPSPTAGMFAEGNLPATTDPEALRHLAVLKGTNLPAMPQVPAQAGRTLADIDASAAAQAVQSIPRPLRPIVGGLAQSGLSSAAVGLRGTDALGLTSGMADAANREAGSFSGGQEALGDSRAEQLATGAVRSIADVISTGGLIPGGGAVGAGKTVLSNAATRLNAARGVLGAVTAKSVNQAITDGRDAGLEGADLARYAATQGGVEGLIMSAFTAVGLGGVEKIGHESARATAKGIMPLLKSAGINALEELPEEVLTTIAQDVHRQVAGVDKNAVANLPKSIADTVIQTLMTAGLASGVQQIGAKKAPAQETVQQTPPATVMPPVVQEPSTNLKDAASGVLAKQQELVDTRGKLQRNEITDPAAKAAAESRVDKLAAEVQADIGEDEDLFEQVAAVKEQTPGSPDRLSQITQPGDVTARTGLDAQIAEAKKLLADVDKMKGPTPSAKVRKVATDYAKSIGQDAPSDSQYVNVDKGRGKKIADWYETAQHNPSDPAVKASYQALKDETKAQWEAMQKGGVKAEAWTGKGQPYANSAEMMADVEKGHLWFFTGGDMPTDHPLAEKMPGSDLTYNDVFRAIHDFFGHSKEGVGFGPRGEENAWRQHSQMFSDAARPAMTAETRGQNSWVNFGPKGAQNQADPANTQFAQQKAVLAPDWAVSEGAVQKRQLPIKPGVTKQEAATTIREAVENAAPIEGTAHRAGVPRTFEGILTPIMSRVRDISQPVFDKLMTMEFNTGKDREAIKRKLTPEASAIEADLGVERSRLTGRPVQNAKSLAFKRAVLHGDFDTARAMLSEKAQGSFDTFTDEFERLLDWQRGKGVNLNERESYWPRFIRDHQAFDAIYGKDTGRFEDAWDLAEKQKGKPLTDEEKMEVANSVVQGYGPRKPGSYGPSFARARTLTELTDEQLAHYIDPLEAAMRYVDGATYAGYRSEFLGKNSTEETLADSAGKVVQQEVDAGKLNKDQQRQLTHLLQVRFGGDMMVMSRGARRLKQAMYLTSLAQFRNAINQSLDLAVTAHSHGAGNATSAFLQSLGLKDGDTRQFMEEIGLHDHGEEFKDVGNVARLTDAALTATGFKRLDRLGKETRLNAARSHFIQAAQNPGGEAFKQLQQEYEPALGRERFVKTMQDFAEGNMTEDAKYLQFLDVTKVQPVSLSNMPEQYLAMRDGRITYSMKTFMLNQLDYVRRDIFRKLQTPGQRRDGVKSLASFVVLMSLMGAGKELLQALIRGRVPQPDDIPDAMTNTLLGVVGLSRYALGKVNDKPSAGALSLIVPPLAWVDRAYDDVKTMGDGSGMRSVQTIPLVGDLMYYWFGKGGTLADKAAVTELKDKLKALKQESITAREGGDNALADQLDAIYEERRQELPAKQE